MKWYKDGKVIYADGKISGDSNMRFKLKGLLLNFDQIKSENAGRYKCTAENSEGSDSKEATLIVNSKTWSD